MGRTESIERGVRRNSRALGKRNSPLLKVYSDIRALQNAELKIFLRECIWKRATSSAMHEASHITRYEIMIWTPRMLLKLILRRRMSNDIFFQE